MMISPLCLACTLALTLAAAQPETPEQTPPAEPSTTQRTFHLTPELLDKVRQWTGAAPDETPDLTKLTPEQMAELIRLASGGEINMPPGAVTFGGAPAQSKTPPVGEPAPPLTVDQIVAGAEGAGAPPDWAALEGKVVVLEFWATWCAPCIAALPHLNELAEAFEDRGVVFLSVTNEPDSVVEEFLPEHTFPGMVGVDPDASMAEAYGVTAIPRTFVVGADGVLLGTTHPQRLTPELLEGALRGEAFGDQFPAALAPSTTDDAQADQTEKKQD